MTWMRNSSTSPCVQEGGEEKRGSESTPALAERQGAKDMYGLIVKGAEGGHGGYAGLLQLCGGQRLRG